MIQQLTPIFLFLFFISSCKHQKPQKIRDTQFEISTEFQHLLSENGIEEGVILLYKPKSGQYITNDSSLVNVGHLPASTFKIANSIVGLELGLTSLNRVFEWNGEQHYLDVWEQDLNFKQAFAYSCVPCYQQLARETGAERMRNKLNELGYPMMDTREQTIDNFWLVGPSRITPMEQIDFLQRLHEAKLPIQQTTYDAMHEMMLREEFLGGGIYGKTGMSVREDGLHNGWFVGFFIKGEEVIYFATNIEQNEQITTGEFGRLRLALTKNGLEEYLRE